MSQESNYTNLKSEIQYIPVYNCLYVISIKFEIWVRNTLNAYVLFSVACSIYQVYTYWQGFYNALLMAYTI